MENFKPFEQQPTVENPYIVDNYPYGYLRTKKAYYVETTKNGQRIVETTLNPKTNRWNNPHKSTYSQIILLGLNEIGHVTSVSLSTSYRSMEEALKWGEKYEQYLSDYQKKEFKAIVGMLKVYDKVEFTINERYFKNMETGEITTSVMIYDMDKVKECDKEGNLINTEAEAEKQKELNRNINKMAILSAKQEAKISINEAIDSFRRA